MLKNLTQFKSVIQGVESLFHFDANCPVSVAKEAVFECLKWLGQIEDQIKALEEAKRKEEENKEEPKAEQQEVVNDEPSA